MDRITLGRMQNPVRGFLHGSAAVASVVGTAFLVIHAWGNAAHVAGAFIFGFSLLGMYTVSALFHSVPWRERTKHWMQRVDHSMIFVLVAGTTTPIAIAALGGGARIAVLSAVWGIAAAGIVIKLVAKRRLTWLSVTLQLLMGWSAAVWLPALFGRFGWTGVWPVLAGGALYTLGVVIYATQRPRLAPRIFSAHELWHTMVVTASSFHFVAVWQVL
jgi:hemolysin III